MENQQETATLDLARIGYEAYRQHTGGISLASGQQLPIYDELNDQVRGAWIAAGSAIGMAVVEELKRTAAAAGGKATVKLAGDFSAVLEAEDPEPEGSTPGTPSPYQAPSIGTIVIYHGMRRDRPAIICGHGFTDGSKHIVVFDSPHGATAIENVQYGEGFGQWSYEGRA